MRRTWSLLLVACASTRAAEPPNAHVQEKSALDIVGANPVGAKARDFAMPNCTHPERSPMKLVPGKVNVLILWAAYSVPDKAKIHAYEEIWQRFRARDVVMLPLSEDLDDTSNAEIAQFGRENGATYDLGRDINFEVSKKYLALYITLVIDRQGVIRFVHNGSFDRKGEVADLTREIESLL